MLLGAAALLGTVGCSPAEETRPQLSGNVAVSLCVSLLAIVFLEPVGCFQPNLNKDPQDVCFFHVLCQQVLVSALLPVSLI